MITAFVPCRAGSQRVPRKNTKEFAGIKGGLLRIKLNQLLEVDQIDRIVLSTNDEEVMNIGSRLDRRVFIDERPEYLATSLTSTDDLIKYVPKIILEGHVVWTHVTSPFITKDVYGSAIGKYLFEKELENYDSLMTVNRVQTFLWNDKQEPLNYSRDVEKWPRTQTLPEFYEINSGIFINSVENYRSLNDRIGKRPFLYETKGHTSFDIDWPEDFKLAEFIYRNIDTKI